MKFMLRKNNGKMYYVTTHYDVIYYIYHRRQRHFEDNVDSYKFINDVIICIDIIYFPVIFLTHTCQLFSYNIGINEYYPLERSEVYAFLDYIIYYMIPLQNAITSPILYDAN